MTKETVSTILTYIAFVVLVFGFSYMLIENTRLTVVNHHLESNVEDVKNELVDSQNLSNGYKWQLEQVNRDSGWGGDE